MSDFAPTCAPFGTPIDRSAVREVWDTFVKPQQDAGEIQSIEDRLLMGILRAAYAALPATDMEPDAGEGK